MFQLFAAGSHARFQCESAGRVKRWQRLESCWAKKACSIGRMRAARYVVRRQRRRLVGLRRRFTSIVVRQLSHGLHSDESVANRWPACDARDEFEPLDKRGYEFLDRAILPRNGWPKYFPNRLYPADVHSVARGDRRRWLNCAAAFPGRLELAEQIADWAMKNMRSAAGFFYYQRRRFFTVRIPYMRWSEAWMMYALARLMSKRSRRFIHSALLNQ